MNAHDPIAIVGMACRFPAAEAGPSAFWELLRTGGDATREIARWPLETFYDPSREATGKSYTKRAALLSRIDGFDAAFFQITPLEAETMDPQQRLVLEIVYEAIVDAAIPLPALQANRTGFFLGMGPSDYKLRFHGDPDRFAGLGNMLSIAAGRVSYVLDLKGPCLAIDTACSASLAAIHSACESLRLGGSDVAIAGGALLASSPAAFIGMSGMTALSADGRCKTWDASGDGYARGEGAGMVVLKRLTDARRDGDRVWALIRGSAVNADGKTFGITAPSAESQRALIRAALDDAGVAPDDVQYVEAHGTGTVLGDPVEVEALAQVFGGRRGPALAIGSVKTNIGHLEPAAGVAGLIKTVLAMRARRLPPSLHFHTPNPRIPWADIPIRVQTELTAWPRPEAPLIAGVSALGVNGSNAHAILEEAPAEPVERAATAAPGEPHVLVISAKTHDALVAYAARHADLLEAPLERDRTYRDVAYTASVRGTHLEHRVAVVGASAAAWAEQLRAFVRSEACAGVVTGRAGGGARRVVFAFPAHAGDWRGMGGELLDSEPAFREAVAACDAAMHAHGASSVLDALRDAHAADPDAARRMLFAVQVGLAAVLRAWGVEPSEVTGVGVGARAAACVTGARTLAEVAAEVCGRRDDQAPVPAAQRIVTVVEITAPGASVARATVEPVTPPALAPLVDGMIARGAVARVVHVDLDGAPDEATTDVPVVIELGVTPGREGLLAALGALHCAGVAIDWRARFAVPGRVVSLPPYPWQHQRFWRDELPTRRVADRVAPMIHRHVELPEPAGSHLFELDLDRTDPPLGYLAEHRVVAGGVPMAALLEIACEATAIAGAETIVLSDLRIDRRLELRDGAPRTVLVSLQRDAAGAHRLKVFSRPRGAAAKDTALHLQATTSGAEPALAPVPPLAELRARCTAEPSIPAFYRAHDQYGAFFQLLVQLRAGDGEAVGALRALPRGAGNGYQVHPAVGDAWFQMIEMAGGHTLDPVHIETLLVHPVRTRPATVYARWDARELRAELVLLDAGERLIARAVGVRLAPVEHLA